MRDGGSARRRERKQAATAAEHAWAGGWACARAAAAGRRERQACTRAAAGGRRERQGRRPAHAWQPSASGGKKSMASMENSSLDACCFWEKFIAPAMLGKTHVPDFEWKIHDFSALLETKATSVFSGPFHCSGYTWYLQVSPVHKFFGVGTPCVALNLMLHQHTLEQGHTVHAVFEFSIYNHSNGMYCGCKANYNFDFKNNYSKKEFLIPLEELLRSSAFLVDDSCVVGVEILKIDVSSPEKTAVLVEKKATTVRNLFFQKKGFIKGTYTWTMNNFLEFHFRCFVHSPTFEVGGHKWYIRMYPRGNKCNTDCLSLYLCQDVSNELPLESRNLVEMTLSIQDQKNGKYFTRTSGLVEFAIGWGWPNFIPLKKFKDPSGGYLVESNCVVKADFTIIGSSNDG